MKVDMTIAGVSVRVRFDNDGRPLSATHVERPGDDPRIVGLAVQQVFDSALDKWNARDKRKQMPIKRKA